MRDNQHLPFFIDDLEFSLVTFDDIEYTSIFIIFIQCKSSDYKYMMDTYLGYTKRIQPIIDRVTVFFSGIPSDYHIYAISDKKEMVTTFLSERNESNFRVLKVDIDSLDTGIIQNILLMTSIFRLKLYDFKCIHKNIAVTIFENKYWRGYEYTKENGCLYCDDHLSDLIKNTFQSDIVDKLVDIHFYHLLPYIHFGLIGGTTTFDIDFFKLFQLVFYPSFI